MPECEVDDRWVEGGVAEPPVDDRDGPFELVGGRPVGVAPEVADVHPVRGVDQDVVDEDGGADEPGRELGLPVDVGLGDHGEPLVDRQGSVQEQGLADADGVHPIEARKTEVRERKSQAPSRLLLFLGIPRGLT